MFSDITQSIKFVLLFFITAVFEIIGCYLFLKFIKEGKRLDFLALSVVFLIAFAWLLTLHPQASGRVYAAYGGIYIFTSIFWLQFIDKVSLTHWDMSGATLCLIGAIIIYFQP